MSTLPASPDRCDVSAEHILVTRLKAGDADAYEEVVRSTGGRLLAVARRMLRDEEAARDVVQDTFLCAFRAIQSFDGQSQVSTWLHRIVVNNALMRLRSKQRKPEQSIEPLLPTFAEDGHHAEPVVSWADSAAQALESKETRMLVRAAIEELPESYRTVLVLRDLEGLSTREAADMLGTTENALKLRLHRARQALAVIIRGRLEPASAITAAPRPAVHSARVAGAARPTAARPRAAATWPGPFAAATSPLAAW